MPPCSLISSARIIMPLRSGLEYPASGPDKSCPEPMVISVSMTPCVCASAAPLAAARSNAMNFSFMVVTFGDVLALASLLRWILSPIPALRHTWTRSGSGTSGSPADEAERDQAVDAALRDAADQDLEDLHAALSWISTSSRRWQATSRSVRAGRRPRRPR